MIEFPRAQQTRLALAVASLILLAADAPRDNDFAADAQSIETLINAQYAYLDRFAGARMPMSAQLRAEANAVTNPKQLVRYSERALSLLADHHAITGSSMKDSWAVFPSYGDLWIEQRGSDFLITAVRDGSPAAKHGIRPGEILGEIDGEPTSAVVEAFWADLGTSGGGERNDYAARVLAAGKRDRPRQLTIGYPGSSPRRLSLPNLYSLPRVDRLPVQVSSVGRNLVIHFSDSLGDIASIAAFDAAMAEARPGQKIIIDLTDTPSGGNTTIARAVLGWFVSRPTFYQVHSLPAEERRTGIGRQWAEQVLPRTGKRHHGPVIVRVGRWTGSMGEGLAIGFAAIGARVEGDRMAGLLGAIHDHRLPRSGNVIKFPTERLAGVDGTPRENFVPRKSVAR